MVGFSEAAPVLVHTANPARSGETLDRAHENPSAAFDERADQGAARCRKWDAAQNAVTAPVCVHFKCGQAYIHCAVEPAIAGKHQTIWPRFVSECVENTKF